MTQIETVVTAVVIVLMGTLLIAWVAAVVEGWRDALRDRYTGSETRLQALDLLGILAWLVLEIVWFVLGLLWALLMVLIAYEAAKSVRDWWHSGERHKH